MSTEVLWIVPTTHFLTETAIRNKVVAWVEAGAKLLAKELQCMWLNVLVPQTVQQVKSFLKGPTV